MRLIDADELKKTFRNVNEGMFQLSRVFELIDNAPTVELDESVIQNVLNKRCMTVVTNEYLIALHGKKPQGEWIDTGDMQEYWAEEYQCSICGAKDHWHNFCPNCGADMKGGAEK